MNNIEARLAWQGSIQSTYGTPDLYLTRGQGSEVWDEKGTRFLDFLGGIATNILGHAHPKIVAAVSNQVSELNHVSNFYSHPQVLQLAQTLQRLTGDNSARSFFCNSGAEANEAALKLSRLTKRRKVLAFEGSFHGRTMGALSMTGQVDKREPFVPMIKKISFAKFNSLKDVAKKLKKDTAMVIVEPIQGERGVIPAELGFLAALRKLTTDNGTLLAVDAVQTGMGRTGNWFGYESEGIKPDILTLAKGLGGGLPIGAMIAFGAAAELFTPGSHGSTFGGNPIAAASANATISVIEEEGYLAKNFARGEWLKTEISQIPEVAEVRGSGLLLGIVLKEKIAKELTTRFMSKNILVNSPADNVIRIAPAYVVSDDQIREFINSFKEIIGK